MNKILFLALMLISCGSPTTEFRGHKQSIAPIVWHWEDRFTDKEKEKLVTYLTEVSQATFTTLGQYPFQVHFFLHRSDDQKEPIPWAHTERSELEGVHFYVNPDFDLKVFREDWTAPHEISHLSIPFLGKKNAWFSEGYATYMQLQIMKEMGIYTAKEMAERYAMKDNLVKDDFSASKNFIEDVRELRGDYNFPAMYWGSVRYFRRIDSDLKRLENITLTKHIQSYERKYRMQDQSLEDLLISLDKDLKEPIFQKLMKRCYQESFEKAFTE